MRRDCFVPYVYFLEASCAWAADDTGERQRKYLRLPLQQYAAAPPVPGVVLREVDEGSPEATVVVPLRTAALCSLHTAAAAAAAALIPSPSTVHRQATAVHFRRPREATLHVLGLGCHRRPHLLDAAPRYACTGGALVAAAATTTSATSAARSLREVTRAVREVLEELHMLQLWRAHTARALDGDLLDHVAERAGHELYRDDTRGIPAPRR